jgi:hypothetical protein
VARQVHQVAILAVLAALARDAAAGPCASVIDAPPTTSHGAVAAVGKHLYWIAGTDGSPGTAARRFDVTTKRWETLPDIAGDRIHPSLAVLGGALYVIGGVGSGVSALGDVQRFDEKRCRWVSVARLPWKAGSSMVATVGGRIVVAGGRVDNGARSLQSMNIWSTDAALAFDAKGAITKLPSLAQARNDGAAVTVGKDIWVIGGRHAAKDVDSLGSSRSNVEILVPGAKAWTSGPSLPFSAEVFAVALPDKTVVAFGRGVLESPEPAIYDPAKKAWREGKKRPETIEFLEGAAVVDGVIYVIGKEIAGGFRGKKTYRVASYDPREDRWEIVNEIAENLP